MSSALMFQYNIPKKGYKSKENVFHEGVPTNSRPAVNGVNPGPQHNPSQGCFGRARPIKHWRKQLAPVPYSGNNRRGIGIPSDKPGGAVLFSKQNKDDNRCLCNTQDELGNTKTIVKHVLHPKHCKECPDTEDSHKKDVILPNGVRSLSCCNSKKMITRAANTRIPLHNTNSSNSSILNNYYPSNKEYLRAKCKTYTQNLGGQENATNVIDHFGNPISDMFFSLTCPSGACGSNSTKKPVHVYKPNNNSFQVQGAVSSGDRIARLKYNTLRKNATSYHNAFKTTTSSSLRSYAVNEAGPYFLKSKLNPLNDCRSSLPVTMRRACPPKPPS